VGWDPLSSQTAAKVNDVSRPSGGPTEDRQIPAQWHAPRSLNGPERGDCPSGRNHLVILEVGEFLLLVAHRVDFDQQNQCRVN
jgi:hypothetical protein